MTRLAAIIAALRASRGTCACGDAYEPHQHHRRGWECTRCDDCKRYRRLPLRQRIADAITASRGPAQEMGDDIHRDGVPVAPDIDIEIDRMITDYRKRNRP